MQKMIMAKMQQQGRHGNRSSGDKSDWPAGATGATAAATDSKTGAATSTEQTKYRESTVIGTNNCLKTEIQIIIIMNYTDVKKEYSLFCLHIIWRCVVLCIPYVHINFFHNTLVYTSLVRCSETNSSMAGICYAMICRADVFF